MPTPAQSKRNGIEKSGTGRDYLTEMSKPQNDKLSLTLYKEKKKAKVGIHKNLSMQ